LYRKVRFARTGEQSGDAVDAEELSAVIVWDAGVISECAGVARELSAGVRGAGELTYLYPLHLQITHCRLLPCNTFTCS